MKGIKMETKYITFTNLDNFIEGPTDAELKKIEEELEKHSD